MPMPIEGFIPRWVVTVEGHTRAPTRLSYACTTTINSWTLYFDKYSQNCPHSKRYVAKHKIIRLHESDSTAQQLTHATHYLWRLVACVCVIYAIDVLSASGDKNGWMVGHISMQSQSSRPPRKTSHTSAHMLLARSEQHTTELLVLVHNIIQSVTKCPPAPLALKARSQNIFLWKTSDFLRTRLKNTVGCIVNKYVRTNITYVRSWFSYIYSFAEYYVEIR